MESSTATPAGRLVAVEGIDGCGKSSLARALAARLNDAGQPALLLDRCSATGALPGYPADHLAMLRGLIWEYPRTAVTSQLGFRHWSHLIASWFHALDHTVVRPALAAGSWVIADSWCHKFIARFTLNVGPALASQPFAGLSLPGAVFWLDVPPDICAQRRPRARATEQGEWLGLAGRRRAFAEYQSRVRDVYAVLAREGGWTRIGPGSPQAVADQAYTVLTCAPADTGRQMAAAHPTDPIAR